MEEPIGHHNKDILSAELLTQMAACVNLVNVKVVLYNLFELFLVLKKIKKTYSSQKGFLKSASPHVWQPFYSSVCWIPTKEHLILFN